MTSNGMNKNQQASRKEELAHLCLRFDIELLYAFGSLGKDARRFLDGETDSIEDGSRDLDLGVNTEKGRPLSVKEKVEITGEMEAFFRISRVDLVVIREADPFLAANMIRGERLYCRNDRLADEYDLYILRRAGDLIPLERERLALITEKR
jgi:hypothetical protein